MGAFQFALKILPQGGGEAIAIGIEASPAGIGAAEGIDGTDRAGGWIYSGHLVDRENLVGHGEIDAVEAFFVQGFQGEGEIVRRHIKAKVLPIGEPRVVPSEIGERGVVHEGAERVLDGMSEHGERGAGKIPRGQIGKGESGFAVQNGARIEAGETLGSKTENRGERIRGSFARRCWRIPR